MSLKFYPDRTVSRTDLKPFVILGTIGAQLPFLAGVAGRHCRDRYPATVELLLVDYRVGLSDLLEVIQHHDGSRFHDIRPQFEETDVGRGRTQWHIGNGAAVAPQPEPLALKSNPPKLKVASAQSAQNLGLRPILTLESTTVFPSPKSTRPSRSMRQSTTILPRGVIEGNTVRLAGSKGQPDFHQ